MRASARLKKPAALLLIAAMLLSLCGCGTAGRNRTDAAEAPETTEETFAVVEVAAENAQMMDVINDHVLQNQNLNPDVVERPANEFHFYVATTETMAGFVQGSGRSQYADSLQSAFSVASSQFDNKTAYVMDYVEGMDGSRSLEWVNQDMNNEFLTQIRQFGFYDGKTLPATGPLTSMFDMAEHPFRKNGLTMIVSNFMEPAFDLSALAVGIERYFDAYENSAACIVGFRSHVSSAMMHVPRYSVKEAHDTTYYIKGYTGDVPCYMVLVGPRKAVEDYRDALLASMDTQSVDHREIFYTNSSQEQIIAPALDFDMIADQSWKKAYPEIRSSYNTGNLSQHERGGAYFVTSGRPLTRDGRSEGEVSITNSAQIALVSANYAGQVDYEDNFGYTLYAYDQEGKRWVEASKDAQTKVYITIEHWEGGMTDQIYESGKREKDDRFHTLLAEGRDEYYLSAKLDFSDSTIISRETVYRVEVRLGLNHSSGNYCVSEDSNIVRYAVTTEEYDELLKSYDGITITSMGDGNWQVFGNQQKNDLDILAKTPNLEAFLTQLSAVEQKHQTLDPVTQYVDFVFNMPVVEPVEE